MRGRAGVAAGRGCTPASVLAAAPSLLEWHTLDGELRALWTGRGGLRGGVSEADKGA